MKKQKLMTLAICTLFFSTAEKVNAQFEAGKRMVGLSITHSTSDDAYNNGSGGAQSRKSSNFLLYPQFQYFYKNNISLGIGVVLINSTSESELSWGKSKTKTSGYGFSVGSRIYANNDHKLRFFASPQLGLIKESGETEDLSPNPGPKEMMTSTQKLVSVGGGFTYMINKNWGLDFGIGNLFTINSSEMEVKYEGDSSSETSKSVDFMLAPLDLSSFAFAVNYFF